MYHHVIYERHIMVCKNRKIKLKSYSKSIIINSGESLVLLIALWALACGLDGTETACFLLELWVILPSSSSLLSDIKSITRARFFSLGAVGVEFVWLLSSGNKIDVNPRFFDEILIKTCQPTKAIFILQSSKRHKK